jgi:hypothetical protein
MHPWPDVLQVDSISQVGGLRSTESAALVQAVPSTSSVTARNDEEVARAQEVQSAHVTELLKGQGIQGVAITSSAADENR